MHKDSASIKKAVGFVLEGELTIQRANELRELLLAKLPVGDLIDLDLKRVSAIDIAGIQLLCSAHRTVKHGGGDIRIAVQPPESIVNSMRKAGFTRRFNCNANCREACLWNLGEQL
jgi:anti-anti-sigma regulatory factor